MNKPDNHNCVRVDMKPTDFVAGDGNIKLGAVPPVPSGNWLPYYEFFERQMLTYGDTECCVLFTTQEAFDAQIEQQIQSGVISPQTVAWFDSLGYMDVGADNKKHFHTSPRWLACLTGNGLNGNNVVDGWDVLRNNGALPYTDFPVDPSLTPQQFVDPSYITQAMRNKAQQFQLGVGGKNFVQYHWLSNGSENLQTCEAALGYSPLCDGVNVGSDWNETNPPAPTTGANPGHCVGRFANLPSNTKGEYDHYLPNPKYLINYPVWYSLQAVVTITPPPPAPLPPPNPTPVQTATWLQQLVAWLSNIIEGITPSGRAKLGGASRSDKWPAFRAEYAKTHLPVCAICGGTAKLNLHHLRPFHVFPELELDPTNVVWLCNKNLCHIRVGHLSNFQSINPNGAADIVIWRDKIRNRPNTPDEIKADFNQQ